MQVKPAMYERLARSWQEEAAASCRRGNKFEVALVVRGTGFDLAASGAPEVDVVGTAASPPDTMMARRSGADSRWRDGANVVVKLTVLGPLLARRGASAATGFVQDTQTDAFCACGDAALQVPPGWRSTMADVKL